MADYEISFKNSFKKELKKLQHKPNDIILFKEILALLKVGEPLPAKNKLHKLVGNYEGYLECHIKPDLLLIWIQDDDLCHITLANIGTHAQLFS
jgi:mRNA interferase YafQ